MKYFLDRLIQVSASGYRVNYDKDIITNYILPSLTENLQVNNIRK